ncbi:MAG: L,D-transpeptidase family protein [Gammaproteobacteria bacterium]
MYKFITCILVIISSGPSRADIFTLPPPDVDVIGQMDSVTASRDETLLDIARRYDLGQNEILLANPAVDRWLPEENSVVVLPNRFILPNVERTGLVLNLPEMRLYYYPKPAPEETPVVITHPVSVGRMDWETPLGQTKIVTKQKDPDWRPPQSLKDEAIAEGNEPLPDIVKAGPDNPLGRYAMRLGIPGYLIHSTNKPYGVGMRVTHGCLRMYPEDIERLFENIPVGTPVHLINQPIKLGWLAGVLFVELHPPLEEDAENYENYMQSVLDAIAEFTAPDEISLSGRALWQAIEHQDGIPVAVTR